MTPTTAELLDLERKWLNRRDDGAKHAEILARYGLGITRWYQLLVTALSTREAWELDPTTCRILSDRLRRSTRSRSARVS